ncbi:MAG: hypothetical protein HQK97_01855 [Nitrospirae bacterium]|nr:hypothetical protein [Nitrospirota bacterium]
MQKNVLGMGIRTAQKLMNVAERLGDKSECLTHLGKEAIYELAAPSTPEPVVQEVIARTEAGACVGAGV